MKDVLKSRILTAKGRLERHGIKQVWSAYLTKWADTEHEHFTDVMALRKTDEQVTLRIEQLALEVEQNRAAAAIRG